MREKPKGPFVDQLNEMIAKAQIKEVDVSAQIQQFLSVKNSDDLKLVGKCAQANNYLFLKYVDVIEQILNQDSFETH